jgi:aldose 1-epimerase
MPAQVGWHPWFVRPATLRVDFAEMYLRDDAYIPDGRRVTPPPGPWDDCFIGARHTPMVEFDDGTCLHIESDCDHWVIYDMPTHALCVEPQSGPPDGFSLAPHVITQRSPLQRTMKLIAR